LIFLNLFDIILEFKNLATEYKLKKLICKFDKVIFLIFVLNFIKIKK